MSTKQLLPNQHVVLHDHYGPADCCLCKAEARIRELEALLAEPHHGNYNLCQDGQCETCQPVFPDDCPRTKGLPPNLGNKPGPVLDEERN